jgi:hypothetical protein
MNLHNLYVWAEENPNPTRSSSFHHSVWVGIVDDRLIGPYVIEDRIGCAHYLNFLQETLHILMDDLPLNVRQDMWYHFDGAPAHFTRPVRDWLNHNYPGGWIGRGGPLTWPARSPDFTPVISLWGCMKENVYATEFEDREELLRRIRIAAEDIRGQPRLFIDVRNSIRRRCEVCFSAEGGHFDHLL